ncbi:Phage terminase-like protein, large subunit, contains N-terminal HTH domain [Anaerovirgula multivorans]|uniref:Phage terminase-like protein, large subunit, contains N-terminal HTH domain n=1 Tax=Anaerovirgula multivorans TaxID=312168 RepID=A0A239CRV2_9FIRM|nr:hypothetical protein [Anaerovirgula multivorans]SNS22381.1 Phage terminase-like protein, large subunit, contains N-terminal HTH domain [Anaerovirgula multivorans]
MKNLLQDFINLAENNIVKTGAWREDPVDLVTFFKSKDYLGESPYPGKQTELLEVVNDVIQYKLTGDKTACDETLQQITEIACMLGKGSGKDFLASGILAYMCYILCCMNDPQGYFNFGQDEPIDVINVAINAYQANSVFFKKFKARLTNCGWFKKVLYNPAETPGALPNEFQTTKNQVRFYKNITAHSAHSEADSFEGFNPLVVIFDEIAGFEPEKAEDSYSILRSSALSRYNNNILLIFISYPRHEGDMMNMKFNESFTDPQVYGITGASWEVNPTISRESLQKDYERDPEGSALKYECIAPKYAEGLFKFPERIDDAIQLGKKAQCSGLIIEEVITTRTLHNGVQKHFTGLQLHNLVLDPAYTYYIGGDGGVNTDSYAICLMHGEPTLIEVTEEGETVSKWVNKPVEDLLIEWKPSKKDRLPVDLLNVADILEQICTQVFVKKAIFDKFNSADVVQRLMMYGVDAEDKNFSNPFQVQIYQNLKGLIYTSNIELLDHTIDDPEDKRRNANEELKYIQLINGNKIDHPPVKKGGSKDFSDARCGAAWICSTDEPEAVENWSMPIIAGANNRR